MPRTRRAQQPASAPAPEPSFRSGAVARMANMPVATLRIWEQRHQAVQPGTAASGHRLYSAADVERVMLLRQLTAQGHAIGSIAPLDSAQLQQLARGAHTAGIPAGIPAGTAGTARRPPRARPPRLVVVGPALAARLQRPGLAGRLAYAADRVTVFDSLAAAAATTAGASTDMLLWHAPELRAGLAPDLQAAQRACRARRVAVVYRFAGAAAIQHVSGTGAALMREPADDEALGLWLASLHAGATARTQTRAPAEARRARPGRSGTAPRRYDDAALTAIAGLPPSLACDCPRHIAELLMQLASFEAYSASCSQHSTADAELHAHLQQVAGASRVLFEAALEQVARHAGLPLP